MVAMRADITKPDEEVMKFVRKHGRYAIPFNVVYGPNAKTGLLTNELLSKKELLRLIDQAAGNGVTSVVEQSSAAAP
jgi:suppressor for copper-sensitivity B